MNQGSRLSAPLLAAAIAALALGACSKRDDQTAGQHVDSAIAKVEREAQQVKSDVGRGANEAKNAVEKAGDKISAGISDATIVATVKTELARDDKLEATKINVDAKDGRVALTGTAPDADSVARATQIALTVKGVSGVDNRLTVGKS